MTFSERMALEREYEEWVQSVSEEIGCHINKNKLTTMLIFLDEKEMLKESANKDQICKYYDSKQHRCSGTKDKEHCACKGDVSKCTHYDPEYIAQRQ